RGAHIVENVDLVGEGAAGEDLEDLERLLQGGPGRLVRHQSLDGFALESHLGAPKNLWLEGVPGKRPQYKGAVAGGNAQVPGRVPAVETGPWARSSAAAVRSRSASPTRPARSGASARFPRDAKRS